MKQLQEELAQIISLTKLHLSQEREKEEWLLTDPKTCEFYRTFALKRKPPKQNHPLQQQPKNKTALPITVQNPGAIKQAAPNKSKQPISYKQKNPIQKESTNESAMPKLPIEKHKNPPPTIDDFSDIRKLTNKLFPNQTILDETPDEQSLMARLVPKVMIILEEETPQHYTFLSNLAKAIQICLCPAATFTTKNEKYKNQLKADSLKMIIGSESILQDLSQEYPEIKTLALSPIDEYLQMPKRKAELWDKINNSLNTIS